VKFRKHALHLVVTAGMVGGVLAVAAPAAHAVTALPDVCGTYLQGTIDPAGGPLPSGIIPLVPAGTPQTYGVFGHLAKGQDKQIVNLHQAGVVGTKETKASLGLTWGGIITGNTAENGPNAPYLTVANGGTEPTGGTTSMKIAWTTDAKTGNVTMPTVQVAEASKQLNDAKGSIAKGTVEGSSAQDDMGVQIGNVQQGSALPQNTIDQVLVPNDSTVTDTYQLTMSFPAFVGPPLGGLTLQSNPIAPNATAATVATAINAGAGWGGIVGPGATVTAVTPLPSVAASDYTINFGGAFAGRALPLLGTTKPNPLPPPATIETQQGNLKTTLVDDGSIWNGTTSGGVNPSKSPISDLGNGILTSTGIMSSGPVGGVANLTSTTLGGKIIGGTNTGKSTFVEDTQYTFIEYPPSLVAAINPNLAANGALPILAAITGLSTASLGDFCGLGGLLVIFCVEDAAVIPSTFAGLCGAITTP
jgi:hypothetical protein